MEKKKDANTRSSGAGGSQQKDGIWQDPRFTHLVGDPRFKKLKSNHNKVKIDKRFESMFNDKKFKIKSTVDKRGRPVKQSSTEDLKKFYALESDDSEDEAIEKQKEEQEIAKDDSSKDEIQGSSDDTEDSDTENDKLERDDTTIPKAIKKKLKNIEIDYARGEAQLFSDSSSDEESSEDEDEDDELFIEHVWGELDRDAPKTDESTHRLAAMNMDWDQIRASDIMVLCSSFLPPGGVILNVSIYPSEYGKQRMAEEEAMGPQELAELKALREKSKLLAKEDISDSSDSEEEFDEKNMFKEEEEDEYQIEKLRQYQLNKLKYYYAVIECDSVSTADKLYAECNGVEYESTGTKMDLRFIPDDMDFEDDEIKDICHKLPELDKYKPRLFTNTALQQSKVELTWDETDIQRKELNEKLRTGKLNEISDADLKHFVAYSSEEEEEVNEDEQSGAEDNLKSTDNADNEKVVSKKASIAKYRALLNEINNKEEEEKRNKVNMEFTWGVSVAEKNDQDDENEKSNSNVNPFEKVLEKKMEKKKARKDAKKKKKLGLASDEEEISSDDDLPDGIDMNDPYFAEEFAKGDFKEVKKSKKKMDSKLSNDGSEDDEEQRKAQLELLLDDEEPDERSHFSLKKIQDTENETKTKRKRKKLLKKNKKLVEADKKIDEDNFEINTADNRFSAVYSSHLYNIDPTDPHFKKTKGMEKIIEEKLKRRGDEMDKSVATPAKRSKEDIEVSMLVKNIKNKVSRNR